MRPFVDQLKKNSSLRLVLCVIPLAVLPARSYAQAPCVNQSPRSVTLHWTTNGQPPVPGIDYNYTSTAPVVLFGPAPAITYQGQTLHACDQHCHVPVENVQGCQNEKQGTPPPHGTPPPVGQWIEVHTAYAAEVDSAPGCADAPDRNLACCKKPPFVVRGFSAKVTPPSGPPAPITQPDNGLLVEWSGSNTNPDAVPGGCKPLPAQWSFRQGCEFEIRQNQLDPHKLEAHGAREVQPPKRVSPDMTLVGPAGELANACRQIRTSPIPDDATAKKWGCPVACTPPLTRFSGVWRNVPDTGRPQYALCTCCPPERLQ